MRIYNYEVNGVAVVLVIAWIMSIVFAFPSFDLYVSIGYILVSSIFFVPLIVAVVVLFGFIEKIEVK